eukprot:CAMPEP_0119333216 /NCGR_PEP_ID=MMETSP1333-20130426/84623_1 /TAXON_ID=418940 /ORGANISM="Scyphosphaera apsteinii, Strain RCC1455" /LENGTH=148 /DNA_ID=CAMNT_0007343213 /DNA_START=406 /DNA_END=853 /DNA_ORIENTATION=+
MLHFDILNLKDAPYCVQRISSCLSQAASHCTGNELPTDARFITSWLARHERTQRVIHSEVNAYVWRSANDRRRDATPQSKRTFSAHNLAQSSPCPTAVLTGHVRRHASSNEVKRVGGCLSNHSSSAPATNLFSGVSSSSPKSMRLISA